MGKIGYEADNIQQILHRDARLISATTLSVPTGLSRHDHTTVMVCDRSVPERAAQNRRVEMDKTLGGWLPT